MTSRPRQTFLVLVALTAVNAAYLAAFDSATIFYHVNVLAHVGLGLLLIAALILGAVRALTGRGAGGTRGPAWLARGLYPAAAIVMAATGLVLTKVGTSRPYFGWLRAHEVAAVLFVACLAVALTLARTPARASVRRAILAGAVLLA